VVAVLPVLGNPQQTTPQAPPAQQVPPPKQGPPGASVDGGQAVPATAGKDVVEPNVAPGTGDDPFLLLMQTIEQKKAIWEKLQKTTNDELRRLPVCSGRVTVLVNRLKAARKEVVDAKREYAKRWGDMILEQNLGARKALAAQEPMHQAARAALEGQKAELQAELQKKADLEKGGTKIEELDGLISDTQSTIAHLTEAIESTERNEKITTDAKERLDIRDKWVTQLLGDVDAEQLEWDAYYDGVVQRYSAACISAPTPPPFKKGGQ
jgi:hypothetical protein